jgi:hypothetical protein
MTPNGHFSAKFRILNVSDFLAGVTRGNFFAERTLNVVVAQSVLGRLWLKLPTASKGKFFSSLVPTFSS